jgi:hypothetical protein
VLLDHAHLLAARVGDERADRGGAASVGGGGGRGGDLEGEGAGAHEKECANEGIASSFCASALFANCCTPALAALHSCARCTLALAALFPLFALRSRALCELLHSCARCTLHSSRPLPSSRSLYSSNYLRCARALFARAQK